MNEELLKFIIKGDLEAVEKMLPATDVHERNEHGGTYLMYAIYSNRIPVARVLIEAGSDINAKDKYGHSVIQGAALQGHLEAAYLLYTYGVKIDLREPLFKQVMEKVMEKQFVQMGLFLVALHKKMNP